MAIYDWSPIKQIQYEGSNSVSLQNNEMNVILSNMENNETVVSTQGLYTELKLLDVSIKPHVSIITQPITPNTEIIVTNENEVTSIITDEEGKADLDLSRLGFWEFSIIIEGQQISKKIPIVSSKLYEIVLSNVNIYGVKWNKTQDTLLERTDNSINFSDPTPSINNNEGSSPFDSIYPWSEMKIVENPEAGTVVQIPKFYYKITNTQNYLQIQIGDNYFAGSSISPAHCDRGDGKGERDIVYVGRYVCSENNYKSITNTTKITAKTRNKYRTNIHNLGANIWQWDYAMWWTINMLYLVEYANWNSQVAIGYGCQRYDENGYTDNMKYCTGSTTNKETYGGCQYRNIEGLWNHPLNWVDGCYYNKQGLNIILNPNEFADDVNGIFIGEVPSSSGYVSDWGSNQEYPWAFFPIATQGSSSTYIPDRWDCQLANVCFTMGGWTNDFNQGLFQMYGATSDWTSNNYGARLMILP